ncbi:MAG: 50S ribosomal protein L4 [Candidatus Pacebacteria bacterium]|nr:50S ribosomal protein L4 [Candidatus Paceibacterota bacterium]
MKIDIYNQKGEKAGQAELPKEIFDVELSKDLLHQVVISQMANRRQGNAHAKDRGEVRGGGRKPWRQKGTGRARHGSTRSPIWKGGGVTFGPLNVKVYKKVIPTKMKRTALFMALSQKAKNNFLILLDNLKIQEAKTKNVSGILKNLPSKDKTALIALPSMDKDFILASRNIVKTQTIQAKDLNALDVLNSKYLIMPKDTVKVLEETMLNQKSKIKNQK